MLHQTSRPPKKRKMDKYAALVADLENGSTLVTYVTLEIGCLGHYTKDAVKSLQLLLPSMTKREITTLLTSLSKIAISCSKSIFQARDHPTWISSTPLYVNCLVFLLFFCFVWFVFCHCNTLPRSLTTYHMYLRVYLVSEVIYVVHFCKIKCVFLSRHYILDCNDVLYT